MTTAPALIALWRLPMNEARTPFCLTNVGNDTIRPARLSKGNFTFLLGSVRAQ